MGLPVPPVPPSGFSSMAAYLVDRAPQDLREKLAPGIDRYVTALMAAIDDPYSRGHAKALDVFPRILRAVGAEQDLVTTLLAGFGLGSLAELESRVETARQAEGVGIESATQQAITLLSRRIKSEPGFREECARTLFGVELGGPVDASSAVVVHDAEAPVANGNGHSSPSHNGNGKAYRNGGSPS